MPTKRCLHRLQARWIPGMLSILLVFALITAMPAGAQERREGDQERIAQALTALTKIGPLTIRDLPREAIEVEPGHNIEGDLLFPVSIHYERELHGQGPHVQVGMVAGWARKMTFDGYMTFSWLSPNSSYLLHAEKNHFVVEVDADPVAFPTGFGSMVDLADFFVELRNVSPLIIAKPNGQTTTSGVLEVRATDLSTDRIAFRFEGEGNAVSAMATVSLPGQSVWSIDLATQQIGWVSGSVQVDGLRLDLLPARTLRMAALEIETAGLGIDQLRVVKRRGAEFAALTLTGFRVDAGALQTRQPKVSGRLDAPLTIARITGQARNREEYFDFLDLALENLEVRLAEGTYEDNKGLHFTADRLELDLDEFRDVSGDQPAYAKGSFRLTGGALDLSTSELAVEAELRSLNLEVEGDPQKLGGSGELLATLGSLSGTLPIPDPFEKCPSTDASIRVHGAQGGAMRAQITLEEGEVSGNAMVDALTASFTPNYYRCEWDHRLFTQRMFNVCTRWKMRRIAPGVKTRVPEVYRCDYDLEAKVHMVAEIHEAGAIRGDILGAHFELGGGQAHLCSGAIQLRGVLSLAVGPNLNDCGNFACNVVRDAIRVVTQASETLFFNAIANSLPPVFITTEECNS